MPVKAVVLAAGGNTYFYNMYAAYECLPIEFQQRIRGLRLKLDATYNRGGYVRQGGTPVDDPQTSSGAYHPLVCRHPETGRKALDLGRRRNAYCEEFTWQTEWRLDDVALWDNRCTMHRGDPFDPQYRRILHRTQIKIAGLPLEKSEALLDELWSRATGEHRPSA